MCSIGRHQYVFGNHKEALLQIIWRFDLYYSPGKLEAMNCVKYVKEEEETGYFLEITLYTRRIRGTNKKMLLES